MTANDSGIVDVATNWKNNLLVYLLGSFSTIVAMSLLLPFLPAYVQQLGVHGQAAIATWSGIVYGATFFSAALTAPLWGRLADRIGHWSVILLCLALAALLLPPQGLVTSIWQLISLRFLMGLALGGLLPCIASVIRHRATDHSPGERCRVSAKTLLKRQISDGWLGAKTP